MSSALAAAGVQKSELVLAWDFVTASDEFLRSDLTTMRDAALPAIGTNGANLTFAAPLQPPINGIYKAFRGTSQAPTFLTAAETAASIIPRGADGSPQQT